MRQWHPACAQLARQHLIRVESLGVNALADGDARNRLGAETVPRGNLAHWHLASLYKGDDFSVALHPVHDVLPSNLRKNASRKVLAQRGLINSSPRSLFSSFQASVTAFTCTLLPAALE